MSDIQLHAMDTAWTSSSPLLLVTPDPAEPVEGAASNLMQAVAGAAGTFASLTPGAPLDLRAFEEIRFWFRTAGNAPASEPSPFFLEFSYTDAADLPGELHRWLVPTGLRNEWEQIRIGIENDRRGAVNTFRFTSLTNSPFTVWIDDLRGVHEDMLGDVEAALVSHAAAGFSFPGLTGLPLTANANAGTSTLTVAATPGFAAGNQVLARGGSAGDETHRIQSVTNGAVTTSLTLAEPLAGSFASGTGTVSLTAPAVVQMPEQPDPPSPALIIDHLGAQEDLERSSHVSQRDSFRVRGGLTTCSTRAAARAFSIDYQLTPRAPFRDQVSMLHSHLLRAFRSDVALRVNGFPCPVATLPPPDVRRKRQTGQLAPLYIRIGSRMETAARREQPWAISLLAEVARIDAPLDREGIVITL